MFRSRRQARALNAGGGIISRRQMRIFSTFLLVTLSSLTSVQATGALAPGEVVVTQQIVTNAAIRGRVLGISSLGMRTIDEYADRVAASAAFAPNGVLHVVRDDVVRYDSDGPPPIAVLPSSPTQFLSSLVFDAAGSGFVSSSPATANIRKFTQNGAIQQTFTVNSAVTPPRSLDLGSDQCTLYYLSGLPGIARYDVCTALTLPSVPLASAGLAVRLLADGSLLVATSSGADAVTVLRIDTNGNILRQYDVAATFGGHRGLAIGLDGSSFWIATTAGVIEVSLASGAVLQTIAIPQDYYVTSLAVFGEPRAAIPIAAIPAFSDVLLLMLLSLIAAVGVLRLR